MKNMILGVNLSVTCADGTTHDDVTLRIENDCRVFRDANGQILNVAMIETGLITVPPVEYAMICAHCIKSEN